jgi:hypothetical protein
MLDLAFGLTETWVHFCIYIFCVETYLIYSSRSRLGCQVKLTKELDGLRVALPQMTRNLQAKDFEKR